jgi:hypothetical protein
MTVRDIITVCAVAVAILFLGQSCGAGKRADMAEAREREHLSTIAVLGARAADAEARADSLARVTQVRVDTARVTVTRWRERTDTLTVVELIELGDSLAAACDRALDSCEATIGQQRIALDLRTAERDALAEYNAHLRRVMRPEPWWPTMATVGVAAGVGYGVGGIEGAAVGAGVGLGLDVARRGVVSLNRSIRR